MITTLDQYFKKETKQETETEYKYYNQPKTEQTGYEYCKEQGYTFMEIKDIAKLIRTDLKKAYGKDIKFSVTSRGYPRDISVTIKKISKKYLMDKDEFEQHMKTSYRFAEDMYDFYMEPYNSKEENGLYKFETWHLKDGVEDTVRSIMAKYNYDNSDLMTDYFDVNFYTSFGCNYDGVELL